MSTFSEARVAELPPVHSGPEGTGQAQAFGDAQQDEAALLRVAALCRLPADCPDDALDGAGAWMRIERFDGEPDLLYRPRAQGAWDTWEKAGSAEALVESLTSYGYGDVDVMHNSDGRFSVGDWYSRFWVFLLPTPLTMPFLLGAALGSAVGNIGPLTAPFVTGPKTTLGSTATIDEVRATKKQILKFKSINSYPVNVVLVFDGAIVSGVNSTAPFTPGVNAGICIWRMGQLAGDGTYGGSYSPGSYQV